MLFAGQKVYDTGLYTPQHGRRSFRAFQPWKNAESCASYPSKEWPKSTTVKQVYHIRGWHRHRLWASSFTHHLSRRIYLQEGWFKVGGG